MWKRDSPDQSEEAKRQSWDADIMYDPVNPILMRFFIFPEITINRAFIGICSWVYCSFLFVICSHAVKIKNPFSFTPKGFCLIS